MHHETRPRGDDLFVFSTIRVLLGVAAALAAPSLGADDAPLLDLGALRPAADYAAISPADSPTPRPESVEEIGVVPHDERLRVAFLGNTFIERDGRFGYLEAELTRLWSDRDIVFRNLGWPGDNIDGRARTGFGPGEYRRSSWQPPGEAAANYGFRRMLTQIRRARPSDAR